MRRRGCVWKTGAVSEPVLRLHLLALNARGPVEVRVDGQEHWLEAGSPAVIHEIPVAAGEHELEFVGRVSWGRTGRAAAEVHVPEAGALDLHYALPAIPGMRGEVSDEPDAVPGKEWRITIPAVLGLLAAVWLFWFAWAFLLT